MYTTIAQAVKQTSVAYMRTSTQNRKKFDTFNHHIKESYIL